MHLLNQHVTKISTLIITLSYSLTKHIQLAHTRTLYNGRSLIILQSHCAIEAASINVTLTKTNTVKLPQTKFSEIYKSFSTEHKSRSATQLT